VVQTGTGVIRMEEKVMTRLLIVVHGSKVVTQYRYCLMIKVKFSLECAMKVQRGSRGIALLFL
jgi:hypothetical protein